MSIAKTVLLSAIVLAVAVIFVALLMDPWSEACCWHSSIDVVAGRRRDEQYILWIKVVDQVEEGQTTQWYRQLIGDPPDPEWRRVTTLSPVIRHSPHYQYHGSGHLLRMFEGSLNDPAMTDQARARAIKDFFERLRESENEAGDYLEPLLKIVYMKRPIDVDDLPKLKKTAGLK